MRCLALFTGGLDAQIAVRMMQRQGVEVVGFHASTPFTMEVHAAQEAAQRLEIELIVGDWLADYLSIVRRPKFGYAAQLAPCLDCRIGMLRLASARMLEVGAAFMVSGEVIGQRPSSLRSRDLETMAVHGGVEDLLLRPLSAKLLPPTLPERNGWVDRELLHGWHGKGRRPQLQVARDWDLTEADEHLPGCLLLQETFALRLKQLLKMPRAPSAEELQTLSFGRHYSLGAALHLVLARNANEGTRLRELWHSQCGEAHLVVPVNFRGPVAIVFGELQKEDRDVIAAHIAAASKDVVADVSAVTFASPQGIQSEHVVPGSLNDPLLVSWS